MFGSECSISLGSTAVQERLGVFRRNMMLETRTMLMCRCKRKQYQNPKSEICRCKCVQSKGCRKDVANVVCPPSFTCDSSLDHVTFSRFPSLLHFLLPLVFTAMVCVRSWVSAAALGCPASLLSNISCLSYLCFVAASPVGIPVHHSRVQGSGSEPLQC